MILIKFFSVKLENREFHIRVLLADLNGRVCDNPHGENKGCLIVLIKFENIICFNKYYFQKREKLGKI